MVYAFVMVKTAAGKSDALLSAIRDLSGVVDAHIVAGNFDVIVEVEADEVYHVLEMVSSDVRHIDGVADTKTYISLG